MRVFKRIGIFLVAVAVMVSSVFSFVGCDKPSKKDEDLSFTEISTILTNFNEKLKLFLATLEFKYNDTEDEEKIKVASSSITSLTKTMSESMKAFQSVFNQYIEVEGSSTEITISKELVSIKTERGEYVAKLNSTGTDLSIYTKDGTNECLYEVRAKNDGGYLLQIIAKNATGDTYSVYQLDFNGTKGKLCVDETSSAFTSLYNAEVNEHTFPNVNQIIFSN